MPKIAPIRKLSASVLQRISHRVNTARALIYPDLNSIKQAGFLVQKAGIALRAAAQGDTEVWSIEPLKDGRLQLILRSDLGYDPELRSVNIERKVIANEAGHDVTTPYGPGKLVRTKEDGGVVVEFNRGESKVAKRYVLDPETVKELPATEHVTIVAEAKSPANTSLREYLTQYYFAAYGDMEYAKKLTENFGALLRD